MTAFQLIAVPLAALLTVRSLARAVRRKGPRWVSLLSAAIWLMAAIAISIPDLTNAAARTLGIGRGADLVLYLVTLTFLIAAVYFYQKVRKLNSDLTEIVRTLAIRDASATAPARPPAESEETPLRAEQP